MLAFVARRLALPFAVLAVLGGCTQSPRAPDLAAPLDLAQPASDLGEPPDLASPADLAERLDLTDQPDAAAAETLPALPIVRSQGGVLTTTLRAAPTTVTLRGQAVPGAFFFNDRSPGAVWRIKPGDRLQVGVENAMAEETNLHFHGFHVSPEGASDNVFVMVDPGQSLAYDVSVPATHHPGLHWYHPHHHGNSDGQVMGGLAGLIVVEGGHDQLPGVRGARERILAYQFWMVDLAGRLNNDLRATMIQTLNGVEGAELAAYPGEVQFFRLGNVSTMGFLLLRLDGHTMTVLAEDGVPYTTPEERAELLLPPGKRVEFAVKFGAAGRYVMRNAGYGWGTITSPTATLATINVAGAPRVDALPTTGVPSAANAATLAAAPDRKRTVRLSDNAGTWYIDGNAFDPARVDVQPKLGSVEEWLLVNESLDDHPFHIHINEFAVTKVGAQTLATPRFQDVVLVKARSSVTIKQRFADFTGRFVFHCHVLYHQDRGMMALVEVTP